MSWQLLLVVLPILIHLAVRLPAEPVFNGDANRHVMTSVFFCDFLTDLPLSHPKQYAESYYEQYPALGLLVWPPFFHGVAGALMTVFGTSVWVPRMVVFATFVLAVGCLYRICRRRVSAEQSMLTIVLFSLMPMIFLYSRHVMLEMPTLGLCILCIDRFDQWLADGRSRNLYLAAVAAALAALTRFDAVVLLPTLLLLAVFQRRWKALWNRHVVLAAVLALILIGPTYFVIWREMGELHLRQASESVSGTASQMLAKGALLFYPSRIPEQAGWAASLCLVVGLIAGFRQSHRGSAAVFMAILLGTYITFTPLAELSARHTIYWLPAIAWFGAFGALTLARLVCRLMPQQQHRGQLIAAALLAGLTAWTTYGDYGYRVSGYADAAQVALQHTQRGQSVFVDGWWDGNLTYHLRHLDSTRSRRIIRADRLLYEFTNVPTVDFEQFVHTDGQILEVIAEAAPACIVFEDPQPFGQIEISDRMRSLIKSMPEQFPPLKVVPVHSTFPSARPFVLRVFAVDLPRLKTCIQQRQLVQDTRTTKIDTAPARHRKAIGTGNTVIDALQWTVQKNRTQPHPRIDKHAEIAGRRMVLITARFAESRS